MKLFVRRATKSSFASSKQEKGAHLRPKIYRCGKTVLKNIILLLSCFLFSVNVFGQAEATEINQASGVEEISLARDDGNGKAGETATKFVTTDIPIHCSVQLISAKPVTVKMTFVAVKVAGVKPETKVVTVSYKTNGKQDRVNFTGSPEGAWSAGNYRIDIFIDDRSGGSRAFEILPPSKVENRNSFQSKPEPKPKIAKRTRKN